jgi:histone deacetylase 11
MKIKPRFKQICVPLYLFLIFDMCFAGNKEKEFEKLPIIYANGYNISILGVENFHPFDTKKYKKVNNILRKQFGMQRFYSPSYATSEELLLVHSPEYLESLNHSKEVAKIVEIPALRFLPSFLVRQSILKPMRLATGGTILGIKLALQHGWAINLSGGYHHAKATSGEGFCVYADVPIALYSIWQNKPDLKVLIVDLDAHQGNGNSQILGTDSRVAILDMFNHSIYPNDKKAESFVQYPVPISLKTDTGEYLALLRKWLTFAIGQETPELIIYNAGVDIYEMDKLGNLSISETGIIERDSYVFKLALQNKIPIFMVLSGGYHKNSGRIIAKSIIHLIRENNLTE